MVAPSGVTGPARSGTSSRLEWPPETSKARHGGSGPCSSVSTATCADRWFTPYSGTSQAAA